MSSAEDLGKKLWGEVRVQRLDELLTALRLLKDPTETFNLGLPALSDLLASTQHHLDPTTISLNPQPPIIELTSPTPGSGKTSLLYLITAVNILPPKHGGQDVAICVLDTETTFSIPRLVTILHQHILLQTPDLKVPQVKAVILDALSHVHVFKPPNLASLIATLKSLPSYFLSPTNMSRNRRLGAIILDSASSFLYQDRHDISTSTLDPSAKKTSRYVTLASVLKSTTRNLSTPCIYTTWNMNTRNGVGNQFPGLWAQITTTRVLVKRRKIKGFEGDVGVKEVISEGRKRDGVVGEGCFEVVLLGEGGGERGGFEIRCTGEGVKVLEGIEA